jgi:hypothetical protein
LVLIRTFGKVNGSHTASSKLVDDFELPLRKRDADQGLAVYRSGSGVIDLICLIQLVVFSAQRA